VKRLVIGIAGPSGSGKTLLVDNIVSSFPPSLVTVLREDCYYKDQSHLSMEDRQAKNYDEPAAFEHTLMLDHLEALCSGENVDMPMYDYSTYTRLNECHKLTSAPIILIDGILILTEQGIRERSDLSLFIDAPLDTCLIRRIRRDTSSRQRTLESVLKQYECFVRPMYWQHISPSKEFADLVVTGGGGNPKALDLIEVKIRNFIDRMNMS